ncbi:MaoC/PaaZ C-terminal domain-containing protein [uncultured Alsobacter sp.]|uniref:MaoC/PaaZ C-terminal domain-containing protein n=1 Tax=uncultured Alsobacter sp. TaxID=1748258 RepID=UPI0025DEE540|nr:MaoC/PaaZ C-terminal domain-containing protein [uncultured Alsobacter sp.]
MPERHVPHRWFEDLVVGETTRSADRVVDGEDMLAFATRYDPQFFHADPEAAKGSLFGGLIASGIYTAALWRIMDHAENGSIAFVCGVAWENVRWASAMRAGDVIHATSELLSTRPSSKRPETGVAIFHHEVRKASGEVVLAFDSVDLVYRRPSAPGTP